MLNATIGLVEEFRAERPWRHSSAWPTGAVMVRDGQQQGAAEVLVPGDIVLLEAGDIVPTDLRLLEVADLQLGEAALTGKSLPVEKRVAARNEPLLPIADRQHDFQGTIVVYGRGRGVAVATGMQTELGGSRGCSRVSAIADAAATAARRVRPQIGIAAIAICALIFAAGLLRGEPPLLMLLTALSLAVAAIPEALPAVVTVLLALGAHAWRAKMP